LGRQIDILGYQSAIAALIPGFGIHHCGRIA